jgi:hypothetical protein
MCNQASDKIVQMDMPRNPTPQQLAWTMHLEDVKAKEHVEKHQPKVIDIWDDDKLVTVEWTQGNGERVSGSFKLVGWHKAPAAGVAECMRILSNPPRTVYGRLSAPPKVKV